MKKILLSLIIFVFLLSCSTTKVSNIQSENFYQNSKFDVYYNKISDLNLEDNSTLDLRNKEINSYFLDNLKTNNLNLKLDIDLSSNLSDSLIIKNCECNSIDISFSNIGKINTKAKAIPFLMINKDLNINITFNKLDVKDTEYILDVKEFENYKIYALKPEFLNDEDILNKYVFTYIQPNSTYKDNMIIEYVNEKVTEKDIYKSYYYLLSNSKEINGKSTTNTINTLSLDNKLVYKSISKNNKYSFYIPKNYTGKAYITFLYDNKVSLSEVDIND